MKKLLYGLFIFISAFFFIDIFDVKALSINVDYSGFNQTFRFIGDGISDIYSCFEKTCSVGTNVESISFETYLSSVSLNSDYDYTLIYTFDINDLSTSSDNLSSANVWTIGTNVINNVNTSYSYMPATKQVVLTYNFSVSETGTYNMFATIGHDKDPNLYSKIFYNETNTSQTVSLNSVQFFYDAPYTPPSIPDAEDVVYFDTKNSKLKATYDNISDKLEEILNVLKNNNPNNYRWAVYIGEDSSGSFILVNLLPSTFSSNVTASNFEYCYVTASKYSNVYYNSGGCYTKNTATKKYTFRSGSSISSLESDLALAFSNISGKYSGSNTIQHSYLNQFNFTDNEYDYFSNNNYFILPYASNVPIYNYNSSTSSTFYHIKIGDKDLAFNSNSLLEPSDNYLDLDYEVYTLSNYDYSAIEVTFDINDFPMVDSGNNINLDYSIQLDTKMTIPLLPIPQEKVYRSIASDEYQVGTTLNLLFDEKANEYSYSGVKTYKYWNSITYRFEFPFTSDYIGNITFKIRSDSPYTITLEERANEENDIKYDELDLTGKYGVGFIPKVSTLDVYNDFYGIFKIPYQNNYRLMFYESYEKQNLIIDKTLLSLENFEYKFTKNNVNSYLLFINNNFKKGSNASILYNSNYFNYCILEDSISTCSVVNPNTDETIDISPNLGDLDNFGLKNIFDSFLSFSNSTNFILDNVTNFFNNFLPKELQTFFFISFGFVVIIMITKIVL